MTMLVPVVNPARGLARNATCAATSSAEPMRPMGMSAIVAS